MKIISKQAALAMAGILRRVVDDCEDTFWDCCTMAPEWQRIYEDAKRVLRQVDGPHNARFWVYTDAGPVKLTLRPGQSLTHYVGGATDEGWSSFSSTWSHEGDHVRREWCDDGRDCDGRLTRGGTDACPIGELAAGMPIYWPENEELFEGIHVPAWGEPDRWQRDEQAELAGY